MMLNNLKIGVRLNLVFGLVLSLLCMMAVLSVMQVTKLNDNSVNYAVNLIPSFESQHKISMAIADVRRMQYLYLIANDKAAQDNADSRMQSILTKINDEMKRYAKDLAADEQDKKYIQDAESSMRRFTDTWTGIRATARLGLSDNAKHLEATQMMGSSSKAAYDALQATIQTWWDYNVSLCRAQDKQSNEIFASAKLEIAIITLIALALGIASAVLIGRSITRPLQNAVRLAESVAAGDLTSRPLVQGKDETAQLLTALVAMNQSLSTIVGEVRSSSESVALGSAEIAAGNVDLSQRTEEQASNLEQTAASMEELSGTVKINSETTAEASRLAQNASASATQGGTKVAAVVSTMQDIAEASRKIVDIISVIDGIAFQTNILALNAAVEAARASEQGRGFAVVASEVRTLAGRSAEAAKEIKTLITASMAKVETGAQQVDEAGSSMVTIVAEVQHVSRLIVEISAATQEQALGIGQVSNAVNQLDQVTQQNAALVEESAAASESLKHHASHLTSLVSVFKTDAAAVSTFASHSVPASLPAAVPAAAKTAAVPERRSPNRATNVTRRDFSAKKAPALAAQKIEPKIEHAPSKNGTDDWTSF